MIRTMDFKMEREGLVQISDKVKIKEEKLPTSYYYTILPAVAMSSNYVNSERLQSREGIITDIQKTEKGFFVTVSFEENTLES